MDRAAIYYPPAASPGPSPKCRKKRPQDRNAMKFQEHLPMSLSSETTGAYGQPIPDLQLRLFGPLTVTVEGAPLPPLRTRKGAWLLALLVLKHPRPVDRAWLAGTLWPDTEPAGALKNLRNTLSDLRGVLGP